MNPFDALAFMLYTLNTGLHVAFRCLTTGICYKYPSAFFPLPHTRFANEFCIVHVLLYIHTALQKLKLYSRIYYLFAIDTRSGNHS